MSSADIASPYADKPIEADHPPAAKFGPGLWLPIFTLWRCEMVRFFRQPNRVIGAVGTPLVFWLVLGLGLNHVFVMPGASQGQVASPSTAAQTVSADHSPASINTDSPATSSRMGYLAYFFPGMIVLMVLFTAIFSTISVIEDRREGLLQAVLVSPASRLAVVLGKVFGGATIAAVQGLVLLGLWPVVAHWPGTIAMIDAAGVVMLLAIGLTALGLCVGWSMRSTAGFHAVMNLVLMPMWLLCGAVFPLESAGPMRYLMYANPLTYGYCAFASLLSTPAHRLTSMPLALSFPIMAVVIGLALGFAVVVASRRET